jgi:hypothetical protein
LANVSESKKDTTRLKREREGKEENEQQIVEQKTIAFPDGKRPMH